MTPERQPRAVHDAVAAMLLANPTMPPGQVALACGCTTSYVHRIRLARTQQRRQIRRRPRWQRVLSDPQTAAEEEISQLMVRLMCEIFQDHKRLVREQGGQNSRRG